jgi:hypothetical protein
MSAGQLTATTFRSRAGLTFHAETAPVSAEFFSVLGFIAAISLRRDVPSRFQIQ